MTPPTRPSVPNDTLPDHADCPEGHSDTIGPFEMDGFDEHGDYQLRGLIWLWCKVCRRHYRWRPPNERVD